MAIRFETKTPKKLLATFKKAIDDGRIATWSYDKEGDFTHATEQWKNLAWLRPRIVMGKYLVLGIVKPKNKPLTTEVYAIYHGRFVESMLAHCDALFKNSIASALPDGEDIVGEE